MSGTERTNFDSEVCPKRVWVLSVLSDDEVLDDPRQLPRGLAFHLSRCPSCRTSAERLTRVSLALGELRRANDPDGLLDVANRQARAALTSGGRPTGRVRVLDEPDIPPTHAKPHRRNWVVGARYAAAAAVMLGIATFGVSRFRDASERVPDRTVVDHAPRLRATPVTVPADRGDGPHDHLATGIIDSAPPGPVSDDLLPASPTDFVDTDEPFGDSFVETPDGPELDRHHPTPDPNESHRRRRAWRPGSPWCNDPRCVPTAVVLPGGARRMMQSAPAPIDRRP